MKCLWNCSCRSVPVKWTGPEPFLSKNFPFKIGHTHWTGPVLPICRKTLKHCFLIWICSVNVLHEGQPVFAVPSLLPSGRVWISWAISLGRGMLCPRVWAGLASPAEVPADRTGSSLIPVVLQGNGLFRNSCFPFDLLNLKTDVEISKVQSLGIVLALCFRYLLKLWTWAWLTLML